MWVLVPGAVQIFGETAHEKAQILTCFVFLIFLLIQPDPKHKILSKHSPGKTSIQTIRLLRSTVMHLQKCRRSSCPCITAAIPLKIILNKFKQANYPTKRYDIFRLSKHFQMNKGEDINLMLQGYIPSLAGRTT